VTHDALLGLLGLGARGGRVVLGVDGTRAALQREECNLVVLAADASPRAVEKVVRLARAKGATLVAGPEAELLGSRLGRPPVMVVGVKDRALAKGILALAPAAKGPDGGQ
jgi:ribosomal protein L7Ae-like RNA K-turn-binding protein